MKKIHLKFFSTTLVEEIEANNYAWFSTIDPQSGEAVCSVPTQSFGYEKALMQKHLNNKHFLETSVYPKSKLKGKISDIEAVDFDKDRTYQAFS